MFKLLEIEFVDHPFFRSIQIKFVGDNEEKAKNYTTLIIGPNGTGKSQILLSIINIFNSLENIVRYPNRRYIHPYKYNLRFTNNGKEHKVEYNKNGLFINGKDAANNIKDFYLPSKVLISAFNFNDKYPLREQRGIVINENYHYLGLKSTNNNIFIYNPPKVAIANLYDAILREKDMLPLKEAFITLELKPELKLVYKPGKYFKFFQDNEFWDNKKLSPSQFTYSFSSFVKKKKRKSVNNELKRLGNQKIERLLDSKDKIGIVLAFLNDNIRRINALENREISLNPFLDFNNKATYKEFTDYIQPFQLLSDLELITFDRFEIKKLNTIFPFDDASSGEYHIILTFLNIMSLIEENSIVLLDEPEISLHPNWQIKYMDIFNKIFHHFPDTHFIIASHSHFLVSDLKSENSNIIAIDINEEGKIILMPTEKNTYGWSAEQILLDVFKVVTTRNYYLTRTIGSILHSLSQPEFDKRNVLEEIAKLKRYDIANLNDNDPIKMVIKKLLAKLESN